MVIIDTVNTSKALLLAKIYEAILVPIFSGSNIIIVTIIIIAYAKTNCKKYLRPILNALPNLSPSPKVLVLVRISIAGWTINIW